MSGKTAGSDQLTAEQVLAKMVERYREELANKESNRQRRIPWYNQLCGHTNCNASAELHSTSRLGHGFEWNDSYFEAADAANRRIAWLKP